MLGIIGSELLFPSLLGVACPWSSNIWRLWFFGVQLPITKFHTFHRRLATFEYAQIGFKNRLIEVIKNRIDHNLKGSSASPQTIGSCSWTPTSGSKKIPFGNLFFTSHPFVCYRFPAPACLLGRLISPVNWQACWHFRSPSFCGLKFFASSHGCRVHLWSRWQEGFWTTLHFSRA